ncbi:hypothetical protein AGLY_008186 [Aphis glycines]|uniref:Uncharacterized protein n=1 Tax=Aphis glycines TaxID=307491 RepID=A0A6G0TLZ7_APHGL|nr:hypothetical protein AGLY_008186 [Aphis glycines]
MKKQKKNNNTILQKLILLVLSSHVVKTTNIVCSLVVKLILVLNVNKLSPDKHYLKCLFNYKKWVLDDRENISQLLLETHILGKCYIKFLLTRCHDEGVFLNINNKNIFLKVCIDKICFHFNTKRYASEFEKSTNVPYKLVFISYNAVYFTLLIKVSIVNRNKNIIIININLASL